MRAQVDERLLQHMREQQRALALWAPGLGDGRSSQQQRVLQVPRRDPPPAHGRGAMVVIAASNSSDNDKRGADIVCDLVDDNDQVEAAANYVADGDAYQGRVHMCAGDYAFTQPVTTPPAIAITGDSRATYIRCDGCDGFQVNGVAEFDGLYIYNQDPSDLSTAGIRATTPFPVLYEFGRIYGCELYQFGKCVDLGSARWQVWGNLLWGYHPSHYNGWGIFSEADSGRQLIIDNVFLGGNGISIDQPLSRILRNRIYTSDAYSEIAMFLGAACTRADVSHNHFESPSPVTIDGSEARFMGNIGYAEATVLSDYARVAHNSLYLLTIKGDSCKVHDNDGTTMTIDALANATRYWGNDFGSYVDSGTGSIPNLDGSANNWNF